MDGGLPAATALGRDAVAMGFKAIARRGLRQLALRTLAKMDGEC